VKVRSFIILVVLSSFVPCTAQKRPYDAALSTLRIGVTKAQVLRLANSNGWNSNPTAKPTQIGPTLIYPLVGIVHIDVPLAVSLNFVNDRLANFSAVEIAAIMAPSSERRSFSPIHYIQAVQAITEALGKPSVVSDADSTSFRTIWRKKSGVYIVSFDRQHGLAYIGTRSQ
jgi:hypothetical protein